MSSPICSAAWASSRSRSRCFARRWRCARNCFRRAVRTSRRAWKAWRSISTTRARIRMPRRLLREAVAMRREIHDGPHPQLAEALNNLGFVIDETGQNSEAEQLFREALEMKRVLLGSDHPEIAIGLNNVAFALYEQRKYDAGGGLLRERAGDAAQAPRRGPSGRRDDAQQSGLRRARQGRPEDRDRAVEARRSRRTRARSAPTIPPSRAA